MFETVSEKKADKIFDKQIPRSVKQMVAESVQAACIISQDVIRDPKAAGIPRSKWFNTSCNLSYLIAEILTKVVDENNLSAITYSEDVIGRGRPLVRFMVSGNKVCFHIKKNRNQDTLPDKAAFREQEAKENEQLTLGFIEDSEEKPVYMIVTFNHKGFKLEYVQIGIADAEYEHWIRKWDLMEYVDNSRVENIVNTYGPELKKQIAAEESIKKEYTLEVR